MIYLNRKNFIRITCLSNTTADNTYLFISIKLFKFNYDNIYINLDYRKEILLIRSYWIKNTIFFFRTSRHFWGVDTRSIRPFWLKIVVERIQEEMCETSIGWYNRDETTLETSSEGDRHCSRVDLFYTIYFYIVFIVADLINFWTLQGEYVVDDIRERWIRWL